MFNLPVKYWHYGKNRSGNGDVLIQDPDEVFTPIDIPCESQLSFTVKNLFQLVPQLTLNHFLVLSNKVSATGIEYRTFPVSSNSGWEPGTVGPWGNFNSAIYNARNGDIVKFIKKDNDLKVHLLQNKCVVSGFYPVYQILFVVFLIDNSPIDTLNGKSYTVYNSKGNYYLENMHTISAGRVLTNYDPVTYVSQIVFKNYEQNIIKSTGDNLILDETVDANWVIEII